MPNGTRSTRSVAFLTACVVGQSVVQFGFQLALAATFGSGPEMDAFVAAWTVPMVVSGVLAGAIGYAFVPTHAGLLVDGDTRGEERLIGETASLVLLVTVLVAGTVTALATSMVPVLVPGFDGPSTTKTALLLRRVVWLVPLQSFAALMRAVQQGRGRFARTGVAALIGAAVTLGLTSTRAPSNGTEAVVTALLVGAATTCVVLLPGAMPRSIVGFGGPTVAFLAMVGPLLLGSALQTGEAFVDRHLASRMVEGTVARLGYASQLVAAVLVVGIRGLSTVVFPNLARLAAAGDDDGLRAAVAGALRGVVFVFVPLAAGLGCFAEPTIAVLLERNAFGPKDTAIVAAIIVASLGILVFGAVGDVLAKLLYAWRRTWFLVTIGGAGLVLGTALKVAFAPRHGVIALAAVSSGVFGMMAATLATITWARLGSAAFQGVTAALARAFATTLPALAAAWWLVPRPGVLVAAPVAAAVYFGLNLAAGDPFARQLAGGRKSADEGDAA